MTSINISSSEDEDSNLTQSTLYYTRSEGLISRLVSLTPFSEPKDQVFSHCVSSIRNPLVGSQYQNAFSGLLDPLSKFSGDPDAQLEELVKSLDSQLKSDGVAPSHLKGSEGSKVDNEDKRVKAFPGCRSKAISNASLRSLCKMSDIEDTLDSAKTGFFVLYSQDDDVKAPKWQRGVRSAHTYKEPMSNGPLKVDGIGYYVNRNILTDGSTIGEALQDYREGIYRQRSSDMEGVASLIAKSDTLFDDQGHLLDSHALREVIEGYIGKEKSIAVVTLHADARDELDCLINLSLEGEKA
ncbi:uncharacterized protein I303_101521 [Kwoniella dejecticola CBS 10117]|uniref:Uncharacterized protein n=1 Tax=Kwoniella dejecticola CBS 10117 TaxID=1296121 RepID=A0A1A6ADL8_9TREE|nr:uncharacterized protein I303_02347 [Kwoniella dejecticola CBS 10117]OBR88128.1 hypothetical protein I303_02347 [Kwoniella dejecticola CBS 10117]